MDFEKVVKDLKLDEGFKKFPYRCTAGKLTIGYGRNIEDKGIDVDEAEILLRNDIQKCILDMVETFPVFYSFPENIQRVLINMRYQLGYYGFRSFKNMIMAAKDQDWKSMINEMKNSLWYSQTPNRANRLIDMVEKEK